MISVSKITIFKKNGLADEIETNNNPEFLDIDLFESEKAEIDECKLIYLQQEKMLIRLLWQILRKLRIKL